MSRPPCVACDNRGCERCLGGPGEQGFTLDEKELLRLRDRVRELETALREAIAALEYEDDELTVMQLRCVLNGAAA